MVIDQLFKAVRVAGLSAAVRLVGALSAIAIAGLFGVGPDTDAYFMSVTVVGFITALVGGSANAALLPRYIRKSDCRSSDGEVLAGASVVALGLALISVVAVLPATISATGIHDYGLALLCGVALTPFMTGTLLSGGYATMLSARGAYAVAVVASVVSPLAMLTVTYLLHADFGIISLPIGQSVGAMLECAILHRYLRKNWVGTRLAPSIAMLRRHATEIKEVAKHAAKVAVGLALVSAIAFVDIIFAATAGEGAASEFSYGAKVSVTLMAVASAAIAANILPNLIGHAIHQNWGALRRNLKLAIYATFGVALVSCGLLSWYAVEITEMLFVRGKFTYADAVASASVSAWLVWHIPFALSLGYISRVLNASSRHRPVVVASAGLLITKLVGNAALVAIYGSAGVAMATVLSYATCFALIAWWYFPKIPRVAGD